MNVAKAIAERSRCVRSAIGCVIVDARGRIVATGYNGPPAGWAPEGVIEFHESMMCDSFCPRAIGDAEVGGSYSGCVSIHAEANALLNSDRRHREGGVLYTTRAPCLGCAKLIANSGVHSVVAGPAPLNYPMSVYDEIDEGVDLMRQSGVRVHVERL